MSTRWALLFPLFLFLAACEQQPAIPANDLHETTPAEDDPSEVRISPGTLEAENMRRARGAEITVGEAVRGYQVIHGGYPETLNELVSGGPLDELPELPDGYRYEYDPEAGEVKVSRVKE